MKKIRRYREVFANRDYFYMIIWLVFFLAAFWGMIQGMPLVMGLGFLAILLLAGALYSFQHFNKVRIVDNVVVVSGRQIFLRSVPDRLKNTYDVAYKSGTSVKVTNEENGTSNISSYIFTLDNVSTAVIQGDCVSISFKNPLSFQSISGGLSGGSLSNIVHNTRDSISKIEVSVSEPDRLAGDLIHQ